LFAVVFAAAEVFFQQTANGAGIEEALLPDAGFGEGVEDKLAEVVAEPFGDGDAEALLGAREDVRGELALEGTFEDVFGFEAAELEVGGRELANSTKV